MAVDRLFCDDVDVDAASIVIIVIATIFSMLTALACEFKYGW